jgi:hypothetical protein
MSRPTSLSPSVGLTAVYRAIDHVEQSFGRVDVTVVTGALDKSLT